MKPVFSPHVSYQNFVLQQLRTYSGPGLVLLHKDWPLIAKLWMTDFSPITTLLLEEYANRGPEPKDPASVFRCYLLYLMTHPEKGLTEWVNIMKRTPLYAVLSGFDFDDLPGVGTFYDFFKRLWPNENPNVKPEKLPKRKAKPKKGKKAPISKPGKVMRLVEWMLRHDRKQTSLPSDHLFQFFQEQILSVSAHLGLLGDVTALTTAGDGTPVVTSAAIYRLLHHQHIEPFIDLNKRSQKNLETCSDIVISPEGIPICPNGNMMKPNGFEKAKGRRK